jgi:hypothetical protein
LLTRPLAALSLLVPLVLAASAQADVTNFNDSGAGSLRAEIANTTAGVITIPAGTYNLTSGQLNITPSANLTLQGDPAAPTVIHATGAFRVLCIDGAPDVDIENLTISGGRASGGGAGCAAGQGGGIRMQGGGDLFVNNSIVEGNSATPTAFGGGGIFATGNVEVNDSIIRNNSLTTSGVANSGGGGIYASSTADADLVINRSTISGNSATVSGTGSGGGGVYSQGAPSIINTTFSGNRHVAQVVNDGGGGGLMAKTASNAGTSGLDQVTFFGNTTNRAGGAIAGVGTDVANTVYDQNTAQTGGADCQVGSVDSQGGNVEWIVSSTCLPQPGGVDLVGVDPQLGALAVNGANNGTLTHEILTRQSPAVDFPQNCNEGADQRGVGRSFGTCDSGAYEFDGKVTANAPDCSRTGVIPLALSSGPGGTVDALRYQINGGAPIDKGLSSGVQDTGTDLAFAEGRYTLEYWGMWTNGEEKGHGVSNVLVDQTNPTISVQNNQRFPTFVITRRATVDVQAADALSGLVNNPSGDAVRVSTARRGADTFNPTAQDLCDNTANDPFDYRVLAPGLGFRTVLERVSGKVRVRGTAGGSGAHASQKGVPFRPLTEPRELPIRSLIDARAGTARLTTARSQRISNIQDGEFSKGIFQVLQSRRTRAKGLTTLQLKGGNFSRCLRAGKAGRAQASLSRKAIRRLRANAHGRFRTRGRHSAATVRGTIFTVTDRCDGTLTSVKRGRVLVRDFRLHKTVVVRAGKSYLARANP